MKILIIGGSRFIGRHITQQALDAGHEVTLFNRGQSWPDAPCKTIKGDLKELNHYQKDFEDLAPDAVVHCICSTPTQTQTFVESFQNINCQKVIISSMDCYEAFLNVVKGNPKNTWPVTEQDPVTKTEFYWREIESENPMHAPDYDKNLMTQKVFEAFADATVYRLPMVYGPYDLQYAYRHGAIIQHLLHEQNTFYLDPSEQNKIWTFGYVENIAAAILHGITLRAKGNTKTAGQVYNLGETKLRTWQNWIRAFYAAAETPVAFKCLPSCWQKPDSEDKNENSSDSVSEHLIMDSSQFIRDTGFKAPVDFETAIKRTLAYGKQNPDGLGSVPDFDAQHKAWENYNRARIEFLPRFGLK